MKKLIFKVAVNILFLFTVINCSAQARNPLIGKWFQEKELLIFEFTKDQLILTAIDEDDFLKIFDYVIDGKNIKTIDDRGRSEISQFEIKNGILFWNWDGLVKLPNEKVTSLSGNFSLTNRKGHLKRLEFKSDSIVVMHYDIMGRRTTVNAQYKIDGSHLIITAVGDTMVLEIIGNSIIVGNTMTGRFDNSVFMKDDVRETILHFEWW